MGEFKEKIAKVIKVAIFALFFSLTVLSSSIYTSREANALTVVLPIVGCGAGSCTNTFSLGIINLGTAVVTAIGKTLAGVNLLGVAKSAGITEAKMIAKITGFRIKNLIDFTMYFWIKRLRPMLFKIASQFSVLEAQKQAMIGIAMDADVQNRVMTQLQIEELRARRSTRPGNNVKVAATMAGGMQRAKAMTKNYNIADTVGTSGRTASGSTDSTPTTSTTGSTSTDDDYSGGAVTDLSKRWDAYIARYCEKDENNGNSGCTSDKSFAGEDVDVSSTLFAKETIDLSDDDVRKSVSDLVTNIAEPFVKDFSVGNVSESEEGRNAVLDAESYRAKRQVVYDAVNHIVSRRTPGSQLGQYIFELRRDAGIGVENISSNPSYNEIMQVMTNERFRNGKYATSQIDEPENNQRERVIQNIYFLMQMDDMLEIMDKEAMVLTAQISSTIKEAKGGASADIQSGSMDGER